jgi:hypothetical protein
METLLRSLFYVGEQGPFLGLGGEVQTRDDIAGKVLLRKSEPILKLRLIYDRGKFLTFY